jgi:hypothetical protein
MMRTPHRGGAPSLQPPEAGVDRCLGSGTRAYRNFGNMAVDHFSVHCIRRLFKAGIYESNDLAAEFCDKSDNLPTRVRRMLPTVSVECQYHLKRWY